MALLRLKDLEIRLYKLTTKSHLSIGAGEGSVELSAVDMPIIRALIYDGKSDDPKRIPYIPASSIHGVTRAWVEKALKSKNPSKQLQDLHADWDNNLKGWLKEQLGLSENTSDDDLKRELIKQEIFLDICNPLLEWDKCENISEDETDLEKINKREFLKATGRMKPPCKVCRIFGYMGQRGRVRFTHAYPSKSDPKLDIITRVAIDRLTGAANEGSLFDIEAVPPGVVFYFFTILENMHENNEEMKKDFEEMKKDFELGIRAFQLQLATLGAHATVGFGAVEMKEVFALKIKPSIFDLEIERLDCDSLKNKGYQPVKLDGKPIDLDEAKYPKFFRLLTLRKDGKLPENFDGKIEIVRQN